jgi:hypothetical protein
MFFIAISHACSIDRVGRGDDEYGGSRTISPTRRTADAHADRPLDPHSIAVYA